MDGCFPGEVLAEPLELFESRSIEGARMVLLLNIQSLRAPSDTLLEFKTPIIQNLVGGRGGMTGQH